MEKTIIKLFALLITIFSVISCDDYLDEVSESDMNEQTIYSSPLLTEQTLAGVYQYMGTNNAYRNRIVLSMDWNTDIEQYSPQDGSTMALDGGNDAAFAWYAVSSGNGRNILTDGWSYIYRAIEVTNLVISGIKEYGDLENEKMRFLYAEALALRAALYIDLCKWWGDVPARFIPVDDSNIYPEITSRIEIYNHLLNDLEEAQNYVDWAGEGNASSSVIRVNKAAVKALRARIALYAAGYAQYPLSITPAGHVLKVGKNAQVAKNVTPQRESELYEIARKETADIIEKYGKSKLMSSFEEMCKAVSGQKFEWSQTESIWEMSYRNQFFGNTSLANGTKNRWDAKVAGGKVFMIPSFFYDFEKGDKRRDISAVPYKWSANTPPSDPGDDDGGVFQVLEKNFFKLSLAKLRAEWLPSGSYIPSSNDTYAHLVVVRYADVLLMYAESCLQLNKDVADGVQKFNWVRERAFENSNHNKTSLTMNDIMNERAYEFVGERIRKYDLIRWGKLKEKMDKAIENVYKLEAQEAPYTDVPLVLYTKEEDGPYQKSKVLKIWGLNRGELEEPDEPGYSATSISITNSSIGNKYYLYNINPNVATVNDFDPDFRSLLPYHNTVISNNTNLENKYGY